MGLFSKTLIRITFSLHALLLWIICLITFTPITLSREQAREKEASKGEGSIISDEGGRWDLLKKIYHDGEYINCAFLTLIHRGCHYKKI